MVDARKLAPLVANAPKNAPHKHAELIKAWADGADIECFCLTTETFIKIDNPSWTPQAVYRLRPVTPEDKRMDALIVLSPHAGPLLYAAAPDEANCVLVFSGRNNKLFKVEIKTPYDMPKQASEALDNHSQWLGSLNEFKRTEEL